MSGKKEGVGLFRGMLFHMRPCSSKARLRKVIEANGGRFVKPGEKAPTIISLTDNESEKQGIFMDFIINSVKRKLLEPIDRYDLSKPKSTSAMVKDVLGKARQSYQPEEDEAILQYVHIHKGEFGCDGSTGGNLIWKQMQEKQITCHTWQSMKSRYNTHLQHRAPSYPFQPITIRNCGNSSVSYAVSRDSPATDHAPPPVLTRKNKNVITYTGKKKKKKVKKMWSYNTSKYSNTPPPTTSDRQPDQNEQELSQEISDASSGGSTSNVSVDLFQSLSGEITSCDGIIRETDTPGNEMTGTKNPADETQQVKGSDDDDDETQSQSILHSSPEQHLRLQPKHTSTVCKDINEEHNNNKNVNENENVMMTSFKDGRHQIVESDEEGETSNDDEFDRQLFAQAVQPESDVQQQQQQQKQQKHTDEFRIKPCKCSKEKDYRDAFKLVDYIDNLPETLNWKKIVDSVEIPGL